MCSRILACRLPQKHNLFEKGETMQQKGAYALGIDLGGTKTLAAVIELSSGKVVASAR